MPSYAEVLHTRGYLAIFLASALSTWGDYLARVTVAAFVFERTGSPFAAAATFAVSLIPSIFGRSLLAPLADRIPYKYVLIGAHVVRRAYARALGLSTMSEQVNQAIGLGVGGLVVALVGPELGLWADLGTFLVSAAVIAVVVKLEPVRGTPSAGVLGFFQDIGEGASYLIRQPVLVHLLALSLCAVWAMAAPEAVAIAYAQDKSGSVRLGGLLMAAPVLGAVAGLVMVGRWQPERQNARIIVMAVLMPLPLVATMFGPPVPLAWLLWFVCGMLQAFMLPLQSTFSLVVPSVMRGRLFGLAGALSVAASGVAFLAAGLLAEHTSPARAIAICAAGSLVAIVVLAARWPRAALRAAVDTAYNT